MALSTFHSQSLFEKSLNVTRWHHILISISISSYQPFTHLFPFYTAYYYYSLIQPNYQYNRSHLHIFLFLLSRNHVINHRFIFIILVFINHKKILPHIGYLNIAKTLKVTATMRKSVNCQHSNEAFPFQKGLFCTLFTPRGCR